ncbi:MAG: gcvH [Bacillales bacterium]|jgi:glycine cleavage system H protein|nr:gcvH [Bacillales bacterium]
MSIPRELRYSEDHEWVKVDGEKCFIGITDHAQHELGDIVFVELPEVGDEIKAGEPFGSVESTKAVSELFAPISGKVVEINEDLMDNPNYANESPYEKAWMIAVEADDLSEIDGLMDADQYTAMISEE